MGWIGRLASRLGLKRGRARKERTSPRTSDVYTGKPPGPNAPFDQFGSGGSAWQEHRRR